LRFNVPIPRAGLFSLNDLRLNCSAASGKVSLQIS